MNEQQTNFETIGPPGAFFLDLKELWQYRDLIYIFTWRDVISKYKQTILGLFWLIIQPLSMIALFTFFFSGTFKVSTNNIPPPVFYFSGLLVWNFYSASISSVSNSIVLNGAIVQKIYFPRIILPIAYVSVALFDFLIAFCIFFIMLIGYEWTTPSFEVEYLRFLYYPLALIMVIMASFGMGSIMASLNVKFRDVRLILGFIIQFLFFITPVVYPVSIFKSNTIELILSANPAVGAINLMRSPFVDAPIPFTVVGISFISSIVLFLLGTYLFKKAEYYFADLV